MSSSLRGFGTLVLVAGVIALLVWGYKTMSARTTNTMSDGLQQVMSTSIIVNNELYQQALLKGYHVYQNNVQVVPPAKLPSNCTADIDDTNHIITIKESD